MTEPSSWVRITQENPDHSRAYVQRWRDLAAQGMDLVSAKLLRRETQRLKLFQGLPTQETTAKRIASAQKKSSSARAPGAALTSAAAAPSPN